MQISDKMLFAAVKKAVEVGLLPASAGTEDYLKNYDRVRQVIEAALLASGEIRSLIVAGNVTIDGDFKMGS